MNLSSIFLLHLMNQRGQFLRAEFGRSLRVKAEWKGTLVTKKVSAIVRAGIQYDSIQNVKDKRASGELPKENAGLKWGRYVTYPYLITHKDNLYVRLYPVKGSKVTTSYFIDGEASSELVARARCIASEFDSAFDSDCFVVRADNLISLGKVAP